MQATPALYASSHLPAAARGLVALGITQLGCDYAALYQTLAPAEASRQDCAAFDTHHYAAVCGDRPRSVAPLRRRSRRICAPGSGGCDATEALAVFQATRSRDQLVLSGAECTITAADAHYAAGFAKPAGAAPADYAIDPLSECAPPLACCPTVRTATLEALGGPRAVISPGVDLTRPCMHRN